MNKKQHKILLTALQNASSEDIDLFLEVDLVQSYKMMNKDRYDNDFDLAAQFIRERDASRDFRIYGEIASTIIDCDNITIRVFSDANYVNELDSIQTSSLAYNKKNVFGKKRGKYLLELDRYLFDEVFFQIDSDNFSYKTQRWSQRLVFYDADGNFASYGNDTFDISLDNAVAIENDFPFFFNKHWVRLDYDIIEEKVAKYSWQSPDSTIQEGQSVTLSLGLDKPSPFGNEELTLAWSNRTQFQQFYQAGLGQLYSDSFDTIFEFNTVPGVADTFTYVDFLPSPYPETTITSINPIGSIALANAYNNWVSNPLNFGLQQILQDTAASLAPIFEQAQTDAANANQTAQESVDNLTSLVQFNGNIMVAVVVFPEYENLYRVGQPFRILEGNYQGEYTIVGRIFNEDIVSEDWDYYQLVLNAPYTGPQDQTQVQYSVGSLPDINVFLNGSQIELPINLTWEVDEVAKEFTFEAQEDLEIELDEFYLIESSNEVRVEPGTFPVHGFTVQDTTQRREVRYNFGNIWENRPFFTGRTSYSVFDADEFDRTAPGPAVLRNGHYWQGRNEEFYANDFFELTITNAGVRTLLPPNPLLGTDEETIWEPDEPKTFFVRTPYSESQLHQVEIVYEDASFATVSEQTNGESQAIVVNGTPILPTAASFAGYLYDFMKPRFDNGPDDYYRTYGTSKPFTATFDEENRKIILTSKSPGVRLVVTSENPVVTINYLNTFQLNPQLPTSVVLYANTNQNQGARYRFQINKPGFKEIYIPEATVPAVDGAITDRYLVTGYRNILYPYDTNLEQSNFRLNANDIEGVTYIQALTQPDAHQIMEYGNVIVNGALLLSSGLLPLNQENFTEQGFFLDPNDTDEFLGEFRAAPINPIPATSEVTVSQPTRAIWELEIKDMTEIGNSFDGVRAFDIQLGDGDGAYTLTVGGANSLVVRSDAQAWWNQFYVPVSTEDGQLEPNAILRVRLDEGNGDDITEGPFSGTAIQDKLVLVSKFPGLNVQVQSLVNFDGYNEDEDANIIETIGNFFEDIFDNIFGGDDEDEGPDISPFALRARQFAPGLEVGDPNGGRNGLGGFRFDLE